MGGSVGGCLFVFSLLNRVSSAGYGLAGCGSVESLELNRAREDDSPWYRTKPQVLTFGLPVLPACLPVLQESLQEARSDRPPK